MLTLGLAPAAGPWLSVTPVMPHPGAASTLSIADTETVTGTIRPSGGVNTSGVALAAVIVGATVSLIGVRR